MKKIALLITALLLVGTTVTAHQKENKKGIVKDGFTLRYRYAQPVHFVERGVEFFIYPNGEIAFNTQAFVRNRYPNRRNPFYDKSTRRWYNKSRNIPVFYNRFGEVVRVGNVAIAYNKFGQVRRVGNVWVSYDRRGLVHKVGGLFVRYSHKGKLIKRHGYVNRNSIWYNKHVYRKRHKMAYINTKKLKKNRHMINRHFDDDYFDD